MVLFDSLGVRTYRGGVEDGWEMSCGHPAQRSAHDGRKCRKHFKDVTRNRSAEDTLRGAQRSLERGGQDARVRCR